MDAAQLKISIVGDISNLKRSLSESQRELKKFQTKAAATTGDIDMAVDLDTGAATANLLKFQSQVATTTVATEGFAGAIRNVARTITSGGLLTMLAALGPALTVAAGAVTPLAAGTGILATAAASAAGGLGLIIAALAPTASQFERLDQAQSELRDRFEEGKITY